MARMNIDEDGILDEPCASCDSAYLEDIWYEWCCDEKECTHKSEIEPQESEVQNADSD